MPRDHQAPDFQALCKTFGSKLLRIQEERNASLDALGISAESPLAMILVQDDRCLVQADGLTLIASRLLTYQPEAYTDSGAHTLHEVCLEVWSTFAPYLPLFNEHHATLSQVHLPRFVNPERMRFGLLELLAELRERILDGGRVGMRLCRTDEVAEVRLVVRLSYALDLTGLAAHGEVNATRLPLLAQAQQENGFTLMVEEEEDPYEVEAFSYTLRLRFALA